MATVAARLRAQANFKARRLARIAAMPKIPCECGCGAMIPPFNWQMKPRRYRPGHPVAMGRTPWNKLGLTAPERAGRYRAKRLAEIALMDKMACACGCGTLIAPLGKALKPVRYAHGHNPTSRPVGLVPWNKGKSCPWVGAMKRGKKLPPEEIARRQATYHANLAAGRPIKRGWKHTDETIAKMRVVNKAKALSGPANPFFGKRHPPEVIARIAAKKTGPLNAHWRGGVSTLPYGPEFTRATKRKIRERDGHRCRRCGKPQSEAKRTLDVHHLDHDKTNNSPENLVTSCQSCNVWASYHRDEPFAPHSAITVFVPRADPPSSRNQ